MQIEKIKKVIYKHIAGNLPDEYIGQLLIDKDFNDYAYFYNCYPYLFVSAFEGISSEIVEKINIAGFLCYKAVVLRDSYIDNMHPTDLEKKKMQVSNIFLTEAITLLSTVFERQSKFWFYWNKRKKELETTESLDKTLGGVGFSYKKYKAFADNKSAFAKLAIDSLYVASGKQKSGAHKQLLKSHKEFSTAMQLFDDLFDIEEDMKNDQFNIAKYYTLTLMTKNNIEVDCLDSEEIQKFLFLSGISNKILLNALRHLDKAHELSKGFQLSEWEKVIAFYQKIYTGVMSQKNAYISILAAKIRNSKSLRTINFETSDKCQLIKRSIRAGVRFIVQKQQPDGTWFEYITSAGVSDTWATGFISFLGRGIIPSSNLERSKQVIALDAHPIWGYKKRYVCDTDSSNFSLLNVGFENSEIVSDFLSRQNIDGGFSTYIVSELKELRQYMKYDSEKSYKGWIQSHMCVSSVTFLLLLNNSEFNLPELRKLEGYLLKGIQDKVSLAYWWTDEVYTLFWLSMALPKITNKELYSEIVSLLIKYLKSQKLSGVRSENGNDSSIFYNAMALGVYCNLRALKLFEDNYLAQTLIHILLSNQYDDGSWQATNAMRLPDTDITRPELLKEWPVSERGCNVRAVEYNRLFSTIVSINALNTYLQIAE